MPRILELDALRGITALIIVMTHLNMLGSSAWVFTLVDLFFVISGYFITANVLRGCGTPGFFRVFYVRRGLRIWPAYYLAFAVCMILSPLYRWDLPPVAWAYYLTFTQNTWLYWGQPVLPFSFMFQHTWTMAIEEQFYLFWPILVWWAGRKRLVGLVVPFVAIPVLMRAGGYVPLLLLSRCDGLALGALLAYLASDAARWQRHAAAYRAGFVLLGLAAVGAPYLMPFAPSAAALGFDWRMNELTRASLFELRACLAYFALVGLTLACQGQAWLGWLRDARLCYMGAISYGLYLYHPMVFNAVAPLYRRYVYRKMGLTHPGLEKLALVALSFVAAMISRECFEQPILQLKKRFTYVRRAQVPGPWRLDEGQPLETGPHSLPAIQTARDVLK